MSTYKDRLTGIFTRAHSLNIPNGGVGAEIINECCQGALEIVTELEVRIVKLEKDNKILESEVQNWLHHYGKESRENFELREEKKVLYRAIHALAK